MKKSAFIIGLVALLVGGVTVPIFAEEVPITEENLALLKGKWEGTKSVPRVGDMPCTLEIVNDCLPLKGSYYSSTSSVGSDSKRLFDNGIIEKGRLFIKWDFFQWMRLTLIYSEGGEIQLIGDLAYNNFKGSGKCFLRFHKVN